MNNFQQQPQRQQRVKRQDLGVRPNDEIVIKGRTVYTRNALHRLEGEELRRYNQQRTARNSAAIDQKPAFRITLADVEFQDPSAPLAQYYAQSLYQSQNGETQLTIENLGVIPPTVYELQEGTNDIKLVEGASYIPTGITVYLVVKAYENKKYKTNLSSSFEAIICPSGTEYVNTYTGATISNNTLAQLGFNVIGGSIKVDQDVPMPSVQQATGTTNATPQFQPQFDAQPNFGNQQPVQPTFNPNPAPQQPSAPQPEGFNPGNGFDQAQQQPASPFGNFDAGSQPSPFNNPTGSNPFGF